jgi:hypothetical protein
MEGVTPIRLDTDVALSRCGAVHLTGCEHTVRFQKGEVMPHFRNPEGPNDPRNSSGKGGMPSNDGTRPQALLVRRDANGKFAKLQPGDRQLYFAFVGKQV